MLLFGPPSGASLWDFPLIKPATIVLCSVPARVKRSGAIHLEAEFYNFLRSPRIESKESIPPAYVA